ncbi:unnamed protein product [Caenorhabditis angaria]|uniref:Uncharacterized protein n=1 Tax=Caenorhabditis angaria TaxID=860376 RepID=A0A9P1N7X9_9PELO|nr:unnamed protein product [Caenorhabditis angaria]
MTDLKTIRLYIDIGPLFITIGAYDVALDLVEAFLNLANFEDLYSEKIQLYRGSEQVEISKTSENLIDVKKTIGDLRENRNITTHCFEKWLEISKQCEEEDLLLFLTIYPLLTTELLKLFPSITIFDFVDGIYNARKFAEKIPTDEQVIPVAKKDVRFYAAHLHYTIMSDHWTYFESGLGLIRGTLCPLDNNVNNDYKIKKLSLIHSVPVSSIEDYQVSGRCYFIPQRCCNIKTRELFYYPNDDDDADDELVYPKIDMVRNTIVHDCMLDAIYDLNKDPDNEETISVALGETDKGECYVFLRVKYFNYIDGKFSICNRLDNIDFFSEPEPKKEETCIEEVKIEEEVAEEKPTDSSEEDADRQYEEDDTDEFYVNSPDIEAVPLEFDDQPEYLPERYRVAEMIIAKIDTDEPIEVDQNTDEPISYNSEAVSANINRLVRALRKLPERRGLFEKEVAGLHEIVQTSQNPDYAVQFADVLRDQSYGLHRHLVEEIYNHATFFDQLPYYL